MSPSAQIMKFFIKPGPNEAEKSSGYGRDGHSRGGAASPQPGELQNKGQTPLDRNPLSLPMCAICPPDAAPGQTRGVQPGSAQPASAPPAPSVPDAQCPSPCARRVLPTPATIAVLLREGKKQASVRLFTHSLPAGFATDAQGKTIERPLSPKRLRVELPAVHARTSLAAPSRFLKLRGGVGGEVVSSSCINKVYELEIPPARFISRVLVHANQAIGGGCCTTGLSSISSLENCALPHKSNNKT